VGLFFVLSGFLVGGLLFKEHRETGTFRAGRFLLRRGFKIYPPFWIFLAFIVSWELWKGLPVGVDDILPELFFFQNYTPGVWGTNWSLGVEEHFYLLLPLGLMLLAATNRDAERPFRRLPWLFAGVAATCLLLRAVNAPRAFSNFSHLTPTHLRIDGLFFGALLAYYHTFEHEAFMALCRRFRWLLLAGGLAGFSQPWFLLLEGSWYMQVFGFVVHWLAAGALICFALVHTGPPGRITASLGAIGRNSYATYLWHYWIGLYGLKAVLGVPASGGNWTAYTICYYAATLGAGFLLTLVVERPFLALRDRWVPAAGRPRQPEEPQPPRLKWWGRPSPARTMLNQAEPMKSLRSEPQELPTTFATGRGEA
jgi:peptidoglycan/LPS O-acetylase OafA/YrhL